MLKLNAVLADMHLTKNTLAAATGVSRSSMSAICNHGLWPSGRKPELQQRIQTLLEERGASAATLATLFDTVTDDEPSEAAESDAKPKTTESPKELDMLLRKQPFFQKTRKHFGLFADPFGELSSAEQVFDTPDVAYIRAALAQTLNSERFLAVVGESGAGKSTLRRDLIDRIQREQRPVIVCEPYVLGLEDNDTKGKSLKAVDIASAIIRAINPQAVLKCSAEARYSQLHQELTNSRRAGNRHVLIIEEAHGLSIPTLKHLKRFYELEDGFNRLLSIVLIGQSELAQKLSEHKPEVREVVQRIEIATLDPLNAHLEAYLAHRFAICGKKPADIFEPQALDALRTKLTVPARTRTAAPVSLLYPLTVGNQLTAAMNLAAELGAPRVTADIINAV
jgi:type II secretory pathway predicted ATPase ExeA